MERAGGGPHWPPLRDGPNPQEWSYLAEREERGGGRGREGEGEGGRGGGGRKGRGTGLGWVGEGSHRLPGELLAVVVDGEQGLAQRVQAAVGHMTSHDVSPGHVMPQQHVKPEVSQPLGQPDGLCNGRDLQHRLSLPC